MRKSGYANPTLSFQPTKTTSTKRNWPQNITWFNPPFNKNVSTNVAKTFLKLTNNHFPTASNLHKIFNRNTVKVSYSCTENVEKIIESHNKSLPSRAHVTLPPCNYRKKYPQLYTNVKQQPQISNQPSVSKWLHCVVG